MASVKSFKTRVKEEICQAAKIYKEKYVDYDYLVLSEAFSANQYYIIKSEVDNFLHLVGIETSIDAKSFFNKCFMGTISEEDFSFDKKNQNPKAVKGTVRKKVKALTGMMDLFKEGVLTEEEFKKNVVNCSFATANGLCTLGFVGTDAARPKSLMKGNLLKNYKPVDVILRRKRNSEVFDEIVVGDKTDLEKYKESIKEMVSEILLKE